LADLIFSHLATGAGKHRSKLSRRTSRYARGEAPLGYAEPKELTIEYDADSDHGAEPFRGEGRRKPTRERVERDAARELGLRW
jgi:hypothetical protein